MERILGTPAMCCWVRERADRSQELEKRARPAVGHDERQGVDMPRANVDEVNVESIDRGDELREGVEPRLPSAPVVIAAPVPNELLQFCELDALLPIANRLAVGPSGRGEAPAKVQELLFGNIGPEGADGVISARFGAFSVKQAHSANRCSTGENATSRRRESCRHCCAPLSRSCSSTRGSRRFRARYTMIRAALAADTAASQGNLASLVTSFPLGTLLGDPHPSALRSPSNHRVERSHQMLGMNGLDLARLLTGRRPGVPVVMITARSDLGLDAHATASGAICLLRKPFKTGALTHCLERVLKTSAGAGAWK